MPGWVIRTVRIVEGFNYYVGRAAMLLFFALGAILLWSIIAKAFFRPPLWTQEMSQFTLVAYFMLGGAYALQLGANVRMDLLYQRWSPRRRAMVDAVTVFAMILFLGVIIWGGLDSVIYALEVGERSRSVWRPYLAPVKIIIVTGAAMMLLQSVCFLIRDIAFLRGKEF
ncbi:TRAP transporter small permease subunit [Paracoccus sp. S-4012]|uniref:TRAP transporter small permease subunit n=1 Tax=Paracoccus sp. S-4012 TaxID=2665648 RepID=UPI0012AFFC18|nr:TRAP transporter small permease subunit [Paracoccus sp. S-4012]MRX49956.1 TRAP transporter small permease subunit [Paracoccus sp. S-4012]